MGYTQYWTVTEPIPASVFTDAKLLIDEARTRRIVIAGWNGDGEPTATDSEIRLNGDRSEDLDHETFMLEQTTKLNFCKTARKPYDAVVAAILIRLKEALPSTDVLSDGAWDDPGWVAARDLYLATFKTEGAAPWTEVDR
jgi:hypothetical protein